MKSDETDKGINSLSVDKSLKCMYTNVRSILNNNKLEEIKVIAEERKIDIIGISESWAHEGVGDAELSLKGYELFRKDRVKGVKTRGGGVLLYVKDGLSAVEINLNILGECEALWAEIKGHNCTDITIGVCYRSPSITTAEDRILQENIKYFASKRCIIMGDFNQRDIDWELLQACSNEGQIFVDMVMESFLTQHVT